MTGNMTDNFKYKISAGFKPGLMMSGFLFTVSLLMKSSLTLKVLTLMPGKNLNMPLFWRILMRTAN